MFKLLNLKITDHPQLGNIDLHLVDNNEFAKGRKPYTSVIIGPNGTGKSFILRSVADIFTRLNDSKESKQRFNLSYGILLRYSIDGDIYEVISSRFVVYDRRGKRERAFYFFKNRPLDYEVFSPEKIQIAPKSGYEIGLNEIRLPNKLIVSSVMLNDRFLYQNSHPGDFYQYLGVRSTSSSSSTRSSARKTISYLFNASTNEGFIKSLKELLQFLGFSTSFKIHYKTKINALFFSGNLKKADFQQYYEYWWDANFKYSKRKKDNPLWSVPYYKEHFKESEKKTNDLIRYLNRTVSGEKKLISRDHSKSKILEIDLFDKNMDASEIEMITHLESLDIINLDSIKIQKENSNLSIRDISSGEYHLLMSLIGLFSKIEADSLILIDEPEISLHPNWQMKYVTFLKGVFRKFSSCHFIMTTHSHFLVSDLEGNSSAVIALNRDSENKIYAELQEGKDTFGWSAEEVLYSVFNVRSTRNSFLEYDLTKLVTLVNRNSEDYSEIRRILGKISELVLSDNDPLRVLIEKAEKYLRTKNA